MRGEMPTLIAPEKKIPIWENNKFPWRTCSQRRDDSKADDYNPDKRMLSHEEIMNVICTLHESRVKEILNSPDRTPTEKYYIIFGMCVMAEYIDDTSSYHDEHIIPMFAY